MTRINTIDPSFLADQHVFAEYREITRIASLAKATDQPPEYVMGTGHMKFFYDKGLFLLKRCHDLYTECRKRGYNTEHKIYREHPVGLNKDWTPDFKAHATNLMRLHEKLASPPRANFYTYYGKPITDKMWYLNILSAMQPEQTEETENG